MWLLNWSLWMHCRKWWKKELRRLYVLKASWRGLWVCRGIGDSTSSYRISSEENPLYHTLLLFYTMWTDRLVMIAVATGNKDTFLHLMHIYLQLFWVWWFSITVFKILNISMCSLWTHLSSFICELHESKLFSWSFY